MSETAPTLTITLLDAFLGRLQAQGPPAVDRLRPGLSDAEMDEATEPLGLRLPDEAKLLFGWHDGADHDPDIQLSSEIGPGIGFVPLSECVEVYEQSLAAVARVAEPDGTAPVWDPAWFPITPSRFVLCCDCSVGPGEPSPIRSMDWADKPESYIHPRAKSLGELVGWWIEALDVGAWEWDRDEARWRYDFDRLGFPHDRSWVV